MKNCCFKRVSLFSLVVLSVYSMMPCISVAETDVTDMVEIQKSRLRYDRRAKTSSLDVSIKNDSEYVLLAPIKLLICEISDPNVSVANAEGYTEDVGVPYVEYTLDNGLLLSGDGTESKKNNF